MTSASTCSSFGTSVNPKPNSNVTPSPTRQPLPHIADPNAPPGNQAFMEAVASLSFAADILFNAAKAMSSAVESLMLASSRSDCANFFIPATQPSSPESRTKDWLARNYTLNPRNELTADPPVSPLLFQSGEVVTAQQKNANEANNNNSPRVSPHTPQHGSKASTDGQSDVSRLDLAEQSPAQPLVTPEKPPVRGDVASPLTPKVSATGVQEISDRDLLDPAEMLPQSPASSASRSSTTSSSGGHITLPEELVAETSDLLIQPDASNLNA
ncbi:hypothetical protein FRC07_007800, partial [Ceratobasidium sp. 392]